MTFDPSINIGQVAEMLSILGAIALFVLSAKAKSDSIDSRLANLEGEMKKQTEILVSLGAQATRLTELERRMSALEAIIIMGPRSAS